MAPIYIPPQPVPIIRQKIRNQADIQEQLRAYDREQQELKGANAAAFERTNIRKGILYPMKHAEFFDAPEPIGTEEQKTDPAGAKRQRVAEEVRREDVAERFGAAAVAPDPAPVAEARFAFASPVPARVVGMGGRPKGSGNKKKSIEELRAEIASTGSVPDDFKKMKLPAVIDLARKRGINLMR